MENKRTKGHTMATLTQRGLHAAGHQHTAGFWVNSTQSKKTLMKHEGQPTRHRTYKPDVPEDTTPAYTQHTPREPKEREKIIVRDFSMSHEIIDRKTDPCPPNTKKPNL